MWFQLPLEKIVREEMNIPLNDEMIKQLRPHEGNTSVLYRLHYMTTPFYDDYKNKERLPVELTDKQINFLARMYLQNMEVSVHALKDACIRGLMADVSTKDIEKKIKEILDRHKE